MLKLGNLIDEDTFLLDCDSLNGNNSWFKDYKSYLMNNEFKSFRIGIPFAHKNKLVDFVNEFIEYSNLKGSYFVYFNITNETKLSTIIENNQSEIINNKVFLLPDKNIKYSKLSIDFWDINLLGYEIYLLKCDGMKECQKNPNIINKLYQKGAKIGITGSKKHSFGFLHKRIIKQLVKEKLVNFWITETIFEKDYNYSKEIKMKLELI
jgi:hypothetical protein